MNERAIFDLVLRCWLGLAPLIFVVLLFFVVPYGRHSRRGWGPRLTGRVAWFLMELPALVVFVGLFAVGERSVDSVSLLFLGLWCLHYGYRSLVYPWRIRGDLRSMPVVLAACAMGFNVINAYLNARWLFHFAPEGVHPVLGWLPAVAGVLLFLGGFAVNGVADLQLIRLRAADSPDYRAPQGLLFRRVSCPNYLGEIVEWFGWALATGSLAGLSFALWTVANLVPRSIAHHRWYRRQYPDYPRERRAVIPYLF